MALLSRGINMLIQLSAWLPASLSRQPRSIDESALKITMSPPLHLGIANFVEVEGKKEKKKNSHRIFPRSSDRPARRCTPYGDDGCFSNALAARYQRPRFCRREEHTSTRYYTFTIFKISIYYIKN